jgi:SAM-dependent methyltransferase
MAELNNKVAYVRQTLSILGPLGTVEAVLRHSHERLGRTPRLRAAVSYGYGKVCSFQRYLDSSFDKKYGTDTAGKIPVSALTIQNRDSNPDESNWYEGVSVKIFNQIVGQLHIRFGDFTLLDFGSGKGRALILGAETGFKKTIGVEFATDLHEIACKNVEIFERATGKPSNIELFCEDATTFSIPPEALVIFFFSPFKGRVMELVVQHIKESLEKHPRPVIIVFYGHNEKSIDLLKSIGLRCRELQMRPDRTKFVQYRTLLFEPAAISEMAS